MKYKFNINNLDCPNCARKIENKLKEDKRLSNVVVNFSTLKLSYETSNNVSISDINNIIKSIEPDAFVSEEFVNKKSEYNIIVLIVGFIIGVIASFISVSSVKFILYLISYVILLYKTFITAVRLLVKNKVLNENFLITISCIGAFILSNYSEGIMVISLYLVGKILEEKAINNSRNSIKDLIDIKQDYANKVDAKGISKIDVENINIGDILVVKTGEKVPVDGIIIKGSTYFDTKALTGESESVSLSKGDKVLSGYINNGNVIEIKALSLFKDSTVSKILELLDDATDKKAKLENFVSKISKVYTPIIFILAILVAVLLPIFNISIKDSIYRALTFLVISCPCAFAISVPLSYFTAIGIASARGILVKGSNYLDNLSNIDNIIFDKTGTLTKGDFGINNINIIDKNYSKKEIIDILVCGESMSTHPIAKSIVKLKDNIDNSNISNFKEIKGKGISFDLDNKHILIGNNKLCNCKDDSNIHLNINNKHIASIDISDTLRDNAHKIIEYCKNNSIKTYMFTGDKKDIAKKIGNSLKIDEIKYEMLPTDKYKCYEEISSKSSITVYVGDGINDTPVLKRADIGISMGNIGSSSSLASADIVLMNDELDKIIMIIEISKYTKKIIKQNLIFALVTKVSILILSIFGLANMWFAVFADTGVTLITILNTLRIINRFKR